MLTKIWGQFDLERVRIETKIKINQTPNDFKASIPWMSIERRVLAGMLGSILIPGTLSKVKVAPGALCTLWWQNLANDLTQYLKVAIFVIMRPPSRVIHGIKSVSFSCVLS